MTENIKELLTLAAKACGYENLQCHEAIGWGVLISGNRVDWAPHIDDGDCFRMMVQKNIVPRRIHGKVFAWKDSVCDISEPVTDDVAAATRLAILRAAAEIGRMMKT